MRFPSLAMLKERKEKVRTGRKRKSGQREREGERREVRGGSVRGQWANTVYHTWGLNIKPDGFLRKNKADV